MSFRISSLASDIVTIELVEQCDEIFSAGRVVGRHAGGP
jgi:hypothetical protein